MRYWYTQVAMLVLAWKLKAERMCYFKRSEFINGLLELGYCVHWFYFNVFTWSQFNICNEIDLFFFCNYVHSHHFLVFSVDSLEGLRNKLPELRKLLDDPQTLRSVFLYAFEFAKESNEKRTIGTLLILFFKIKFIVLSWWSQLRNVVICGQIFRFGFSNHIVEFITPQ